MFRTISRDPGQKIKDVSQSIPDAICTGKRKEIVAMIQYIFLLCILSILGFSASAAARSLYRDSLEVTARLDADGRLHVVERQAYVFTGAWNGGDRTFNIRPGQELDFHRLTRIDPAGAIAAGVATPGSSGGSGGGGGGGW
jgi:hypothetical protein